MASRLAEVALPFLARDLAEGRHPHRFVRLKRAIREAQLDRARTSGDTTSLETALMSFWKGEAGSKFHQQHIEGRLSHFLENHADIIDRFRDIAVQEGLEITRLVEIGCGDGNVLKYCAEALPDIPAFVGIDLNGDAIADDSRRFAEDPRFSFIHEDAKAWLAQNPQPGTVVLTNGGVLEYFSPTSLSGLFSDLARHTPCAVILIEPRSPEHDFDTDPDSQVFGRESSFSHNYPDKLKQAGFVVDECRLMTTSWVDWALLIAHKD